ncbi:MAG: TonB-dependent receptor [Methylophilaceae bacterium]|nr:TonB-dependent receptor [Methylophilaceae bacterium]MDG1454306.1 TonB-dependent receptor [Methylophilaceae bacterium]
MTLRPKLKFLTIVIIAYSAPQISFAEDDAENTMRLSPVVVTATRVEQNSFDLPVAIDVVTKKDIQDGQLQMTLSESLIRVPGITAQNRTQQAQDPQISSRGFGSRASFGVRGIRIYLDGIPLTMPDGQGQPGIVDLSAVKSVEVMRGPFSALYGNTSGGVIQMLTENVPVKPEVGGSIMFGSYNTKREILKASGNSENLEYLLNVSNFSSDGYRDNSKSDKQLATAKFKFNISDSTKLTTLVNWFQQDAQDPNGLTKADVKADRKGVVPAVTNADLKVSRSHAQVGFNLEHQLNENNALNLITYVGTRENEQIIATHPLGANARNSQISREFYGADLRWDNKGQVFDKAYNISFGLNYGKSIDARLDTNILAAGLPISTLNRQEDNTVFNFDQYVQGKLSVLDNVDLHAGLRHTRVNLNVEDQLLPPDNSGAVTYEKTNPVIGAVWKVTPSFNLYANYGRGFETPTFFEASFNSTANTATPNLNLKPSESQNVEIGAKAFVTDNTQINLTAFSVKTKDELVVSASQFGRTVYANANDTSRTGLELSVDSEFDHNISTYFSYSLLNAKFDSAYVGNAGLIASGNRIPGTYKTQLYGEVAWKYQPLGFKTAFEASHNSKVYVNDVNSETAPAYTLFNLRAGFEQKLAHWHFKEYVRVENLFDKEYIGSVRINDGNGRFYEPAAGRNYLLGLTANYKF